MNINSTNFLIKVELFEHGVFPTPSKLTLLSVISLFSSLNLVADIDNKVTLEQFIESAAKYIPSLSPRDSEVYFMVFKVLSENNAFGKDAEPQTYMQMGVKKSLSGKTPSYLKADTRKICLFMFLQLYSSYLRHNMDKMPKDLNISWTATLNSQFNESIRGAQTQNYMNSPINSPRAKTARTLSANEYNQMQYFIKSNLKAILNFVSNDIKGEDALTKYLTENEFNLLEFLFGLEKQTTSISYPLSKYTNLFSLSPKANLQSVADWLSSRIVASDTSKLAFGKLI